MSRKHKLVVGNWKMHGSLEANQSLLDSILKSAPFTNHIAVCVPALYLMQARQVLKDSSISWGAQDCSAWESGAYTGEIAPSMLADLGCRYVIVGHSERRTYHHETDQLVANKAKAALSKGITPIVCVGETLEQRESGLTEEIVKKQLSSVIHTLGPCISEVVVAYEPVWAIGTGKTASPEQAQAVHAVLRTQLRAATQHADDMRLLYGGSVKPDNVAILFAQPDIDGGLIGGASLKAAEFVPICQTTGA